MSTLLIKAPISIAFSPLSLDEELFIREFDKLHESDDDPIGQWLKLARARGETANSDPVLLSLVVELYRRIDALEMALKNEKPSRLALAHEAEIDSIGFEHFKLCETLLEEGITYYGRVTMPVHPKRDIALFFKAIDGSLAQVTKIHKRDEREWGAYLTARERFLIREAKESRE